MFTHTATIGRNVGSAPMDYREWLLFQMATSEYMRTIEGEFSSRSGFGSWGNVREDSVTFTVLSEEPITKAHELELKGNLAGLCQRFSQDAIALSLNVESELITWERHSGV